MASPSPSTRFDAIDALRGLAMVWMTVYHFVFDLNHFGYVRQDFYADPVWTTQRSMILSLFLFCAGMGQSIALRQGQSWGRFWRRWIQVAAGAVLVSAGSWLMYPRSFIYFGVLHGIAVMLVVARLTAHWGNWLWLWGVVALVARFTVPEVLAQANLSEPFNSVWLNWLGLATRKPITEDYVPLLPWLALVWWGVAAGNLLQARQQSAVLTWRPAHGPGQALVWLGRWSLSYYLLHQPVMIGALSLWGWLQIK